MNHPEATVVTPFAHLGLQFCNEKLTKISFMKKRAEIPPLSNVAKSVSRQLLEYCSKDRQDFEFDVPYQLEGTDFQKRVWAALRKIPRGKVVTYGTLAKQLNTSARAVGNACRKNPIPIVIPCHRVISASGFGGYAGETNGAIFNIKKWLLNHEHCVIPQ